MKTYWGLSKYFSLQQISQKENWTLRCLLGMRATTNSLVGDEYFKFELNQAIDKYIERIKYVQQTRIAERKRARNETN